MGSLGVFYIKIRYFARYLILRFNTIKTKPMDIDWLRMYNYIDILCKRSYIGIYNHEKTVYDPSYRSSLHRGSVYNFIPG